MTLAHVIETVQAMTDALAQAEVFIKNGVALGFIRMPDADCPDSAHETPGKIDAALSSGRALLAQMQARPYDDIWRALPQEGGRAGT